MGGREASGALLGCRGTGVLGVRGSVQASKVETLRANFLNICLTPFQSSKI